MKISAGAGKWLVVALLGLAMVAAGGKEEKEAKEGKKHEGNPPKAEKAPDPGKAVGQRAKELARSEMAYEKDPVEACSRLFDLSAEQKTKFRDLGQQREAERRKLVLDLNDRYADKVKEVLTDEQKPLFEKVLAALKTYRDTVRAAGDELKAAVGPAVFAEVVAGRKEVGPEMVRFLDLTAEQQGKMKEIQGAREKAMEEARKSIQQPADKNDKAAMEKFNQDKKAAEDKARADVKDKINNILTPEQRQQLEKIQAAVQTFNDKVKQAEEAYRKTLDQAFGLGGK